MENLECYLVGGAVRDELLGKAVKDRDWVVVGASVVQMRALGFTQVGRDFPVFLHPRTKEEYALARTERKRGPGHQGFTVDAHPGVTLQEDLQRRDLTINAIARAADGQIIDPFNGLDDLRNGVLRHVSDAFVEDPLRVFRVARLAASLPAFTVHVSTAELMRRVCRSDDLLALSAERVWQELSRALAQIDAARFFAVLEPVDGLRYWFAELADKQVQYPAAALSTGQRFALLPLRADELQTLAQRLKVPKGIVQQAQDYRQFGESLVRWSDLSPERLCDMLLALHVNHEVERVEELSQLLKLTEPQLAQSLAQFRALAGAFNGVELRPDKHIGPGIAYGRALRAMRVEWLAQQLR
ncbi:MAG: multifunctional CCA tRNA nucleotidyl transferase/2'3'-cyclic phosphodiesterase/2'nucleotidase/phosphatase [Pseudomonadota bacterium]